MKRYKNYIIDISKHDNGRSYEVTSPDGFSIATIGASYEVSEKSLLKQVKKEIDIDLKKLEYMANRNGIKVI